MYQLSSIYSIFSEIALVSELICILLFGYLLIFLAYKYPPFYLSILIAIIAKKIARKVHIFIATNIQKYPKLYPIPENINGKTASPISKDFKKYYKHC